MNAAPRAESTAGVSLSVQGVPETIPKGVWLALMDGARLDHLPRYLQVWSRSGWWLKVEVCPGAGVRVIGWRTSRWPGVPWVGGSPLRLHL